MSDDKNKLGHPEITAPYSAEEAARDIVFSKREAQNIINSAQAQYFRWLLKHHSGTDGKRCWIGGVDFPGTDIQDAIDAAIEREQRG